MTQPLLSLSALTKAYPGIVANDSLSLEIGAGQVHALLGENGAGKSTLVKMIYGLVKPDSGAMQMNGTPFAPSEPRAARAAGVGMVFQHFSLFDAMTVAENIALGMENAPKLNALSAQITQVSESYGLPLSPDRIVGDLSAGERQRVEIIRCLLQEPKLLIMDEPTAALGPSETAMVADLTLRLKDEGIGIFLISHDMHDVFDLCDRVIVMNKGRNVGAFHISDVNKDDILSLIIKGTLPDDWTPRGQGA